MTVHPDPRLDLDILARGVVADQEMAIKLVRDPIVAYIEHCKKVHGPMADTAIGHALNAAELHQQQRLGKFRRPNLIFLSYVKHTGAVRRDEIQPHYWSYRPHGYKRSQQVTLCRVATSAG